MRHPVTLLDALHQHPGAFDFYAALRELECAHPAMPRIGQAMRPQDEALRFGQHVSMAFEPNMLAALHPPAGQSAPRLLVNFFGLCGANGPMPLHITEYVRDRLRNAADPTMARFFDVFHHRLISLLYRAWADAQPAVSLDRPAEDRFADYVGSLTGRGTPAVQQRDSVSGMASLHYAGLLANKSRNAEGLAAILGDYFKLPVRVQQFVGHWTRMPEDSGCILRSGPQAQVLGQSTALGTRMWNCQHKFRIVIGPLDLAQVRAMLPGGASARRLVDWVRNYAGLAFEWDLKLVVKKEALPRLVLGRDARLGWSSWLSSKPPAVDDSQLCFKPCTSSRHAVP